MPAQLVFLTGLTLGYVAWLLCFGTYIWPRFKTLEPFEAQRAIATLHSFRFFGLVIILPGVVGNHLPASFAVFAAYGDLATAIPAMLALLSAKIRPLFWLFVVAFNVVGTVDILLDVTNPGYWVYLAAFTQKEILSGLNLIGDRSNLQRLLPF